MGQAWDCGPRAPQLLQCSASAREIRDCTSLHSELHATEASESSAGNELNCFVLQPEACNTKGILRNSDDGWTPRAWWEVAASNGWEKSFMARITVADCCSPLLTAVALEPPVL